MRKTVARKPRRKADARLTDTRVIPGSGNIFVDLGFDEAEARVMALRVQLMMQLRERLKEEGYTQAEAAKRLGVTQPRVHPNCGLRTNGTKDRRPGVYF